MFLVREKVVYVVVLNAIDTTRTLPCCSSFHDVMKGLIVMSLGNCHPDEDASNASEDEPNKSGDNKQFEYFS